MRKVTLAAIQAGNLPSISASELNPTAIIEGHVIPRINLQAALLEQCAAKGTTLAVSNEDIGGVCRYLTKDADLFNELTQLSSYIIEEKMSKLAADKNMYIGACYIKRINNFNYNVTSIFGPMGTILGEYRKTHIPPDEMWQIKDGESLNVIELEFGKVGVLTCYDMMFPEAASTLALAGAEIILHPTAGYGWYDSIGEATLRTRANDNSVYIVTAKNYVHNGAGKSSVIDYWGQVLADAGFYENAVVSKTVDLDVPKVQPDWFYQTNMSGIAEIKKRYLKERRPELYGAVVKPAERLRIPDEAERAMLTKRIDNGECRWG